MYEIPNAYSTVKVILCCLFIMLTLLKEVSLRGSYFCSAYGFGKQVFEVVILLLRFIRGGGHYDIVYIIFKIFEVIKST